MTSANMFPNISKIFGVNIEEKYVYLEQINKLIKYYFRLLLLSFVFIISGFLFIMTTSNFKLMDATVFIISIAACFVIFTGKRIDKNRKQKREIEHEINECSEKINKFAELLEIGKKGLLEVEEGPQEHIHSYLIAQAVELIRLEHLFMEERENSSVSNESLAKIGYRVEKAKNTLDFEILELGNLGFKVFTLEYYVSEACG